MEPGNRRPGAAVPVARLLRPRTVAIVGAAPEPGSIGGNALANLERAGFAGELHLVSRNRKEIKGRPCVPTIDDLPEGLDAVVLVVPEAAVRDAVAACVRRRAGSAVIFASGFAEAGAEGRAKQDEIAAMARDGGLVLNGPNCIGFTNFADGVALTFEPLGTEWTACKSGVAVIAQSGAMTTNIRIALIAKGVPVSHAISTGNEAGAGIEDFLADILDQDGVSIVTLFVEQVRRPALFLELVRRARAQGTTLVLMHPGRTQRARQSAATHTGALAGDHAVLATVLAAENVLLVDTLDELFDVTALLMRWPRPPALGAAVVTNSGAFRGIALDLAAEIGLELPELALETTARLTAMLPSYAAIDNPLDITTIGLAQPDIFGQTAQAVLDDAAVGGLVGAYIPGTPQLQMVRARSLLPVIERSEKPVAFALFGDETRLSPEFTDTVRASAVPLFRSPDRAMRAMARLLAHGRNLARRPASAAAIEAPPLPGGGVIPEWRAKAWLAAAGIAVPPGALARSVDEAVAIAPRAGFPVALKAQAAALSHKSDAGGVVLGIADEAALRAAWARLHQAVGRARPDVALDGVLVEAMAQPGLEMIVGARRDREWGPIVMIGLGGIWTEALADVRLLVPESCDEASIVAELRQLKGAALLAGMRGGPPLDERAVAGVAATLGRLIEAVPEIAEIEINPLVVHASGATALDALLVVGEGGG